MKIDGFQNIPSILQNFPTERGTSSGPTTNPVSQSSLSLSSFGEVFQNLQREAGKAGESRAARVEALSQDFAKGKLSVDLEKIASRMLDLNVIDFQG